MHKTSASQKDFSCSSALCCQERGDKMRYHAQDDELEEEEYDDEFDPDDDDE